MTGVEFILRHSNDTDINTEDRNGYTPLILASVNGHHKVVQLLLEEEEIDVNKAFDGSTALMLTYRIDIAQLLLEKDDININKVDMIGMNALMYAINDGKSEILQLLLDKEEIGINMVDYVGRTALMLAYESYETLTEALIVEMVELLLEKDRIDINKADNVGLTALYYASKAGHPEAIELLLQRPEIDINHYGGITALWKAAKCGHTDGHTEVVQLLLEHPKTNITKGTVADINDKIVSAMFYRNITNLDLSEEVLVAAFLGNLTEVSFLLQNNESILNTYDSFHRTPLFWASTRGHTEVAKFLLSQNNILVNARRSNIGTTALHQAGKHGHTGVVKLLLDHPRILVNVGRSSDGANALFQASRYGHSDVVNILLEHPTIDVNYATFDRKTSLMAASKYGNADVVKKLLSLVNIDVNHATFDGITTLIYAVIKKEPLILELLLRCPKTNSNILDEEYKTALDRAKEMNYTELIQLFHIRGTLQITRGHTCCSKTIDRGLHVAVENKDLHWTKTFLVCPGIEINIHNKKGYTPLNLATEKGLRDMVVIFLSDQRIDVNKPNSGTKNNAIQISSKKGHTAIVKLLLRHNQTFVNQENTRKQSALSVALQNMNELSSRRRYFLIVKLLLKCPKTKVTIESPEGTDIEQLVDLHSVLMERNPTCCLKVNESLLSTSWLGDFRAIRGLLQCPGSESSINTVDKKGRTPLYIASMEGHLLATEVLLNSSDIDVNIGVRIGGGTPFSKASERARFKVMKTLILHGQSEEEKGWCSDNWVPYLKPCYDISDLSAKTTQPPTPKPTSGELSHVGFKIITHQLIEIKMMKDEICKTCSSIFNYLSIEAVVLYFYMLSSVKHIMIVTITDYTSCNNTYFSCGDNNAQCIPWPWVCDGDKDCSNGKDESTNLCNYSGACGGNFTTSYGLLTSPSYPDNYPALKECVYIISQPTGTFMDLSIHFLYLSQKNGKDDCIELRDGISQLSPLIGKFLGSGIPTSIQTTQNNMWMK